MDDEEHEQEVAAGGGALVGRHLSKRSRKNKGLVIVFDANARKEYVTGFHKRKKKRRKLAEHQKQVRDRQKRLQERRERRLALAEAVAQSESQDVAEDGNEELLSDQNECDKTGLRNGTVMYEDEDMTTVVNTYSIDMDMNADTAAHNHLEPGKAVASLLARKPKKTAKKLPQINRKSSGKKRKQSSGKKGKHGSKGKKRRL